MNNVRIDSTATLRQALSRLNALPGRVMTLIVEGPDGRVAGTLTDGDVRRAIIAGLTLDSPVAQAAHPAFRAITADMTPRAVVEMLRSCRSEGINVVPRLSPDGTLAEVIDLSTTRSRLPLHAVLMAGGKGERLRPLTDHTPKPLLEVDGKAIIDYNVEALAACGVRDITVATRHLAEKIEAHFSKPVADVQVRCVRESEPLGTAGALSLIDHLPGGLTLVMNSDLLTTIDFEEMYLNHVDTRADITVAVIPYQVSVPYAILATDGNLVTGIEEKPSYSYFANAGIYLFANDFLRTMRPGERVDATDLVARAIADGRRVVYYPVKGTWIDIGSPVDFSHAAELMRHYRSLTDSSKQPKINKI